MARGKNSRALFEVIKQSQEQQARRANTAPRASAAGGLLGWFRRAAVPSAKPARLRVAKQVDPVMRELPVEAAPVEEMADRAAGAAQPIAPPVYRALRQHDNETFVSQRAAADEGDEEHANDRPAASDEPAEWPHHASTEPADAAHEAEVQAEPTFASRADESNDELPATSVAAPSHQWDEPDSTAAAPSSHDTAITTALRDDDEPPPPRRSGGARALQMSISYPSMAIAAVALLMLMVVAFLAGRNTAPRVALSGPTLEQLQQSKPAPDVMNLRNTPPEATLSQNPETKPPAATKVQPPAGPVVAANTEAPSPDKRRVGGRNYIIAQSYPDPDNAEKAADLLRKNNIPVTVEQLDAAPGWFCVVTEVGFDRVSSPDCERYQKLIKDLSAEAKAARLKSFEPYLYKWK